MSSSSSAGLGAGAVRPIRASGRCSSWAASARRAASRGASRPSARRRSSGVIGSCSTIWTAAESSRARRGCPRHQRRRGLGRARRRVLAEVVRRVTRRRPRLVGVLFTEGTRWPRHLCSAPGESFATLSLHTAGGAVGASALGVAFSPPLSPAFAGAGSARHLPPRLRGDRLSRGRGEVRRGVGCGAPVQNSARFPWRSTGMTEMGILQRSPYAGMTGMGVLSGPPCAGTGSQGGSRQACLGVFSAAAGGVGEGVCGWVGG